MKSFIFTILLMCSFTLEAKKKHPAEIAREKNLPAVTMYMDISAFGRKDRSAKRMTELHKVFGENGFTLIGVNPYTENGDLQGFFISYVSEVKNPKD